MLRSLYVPAPGTAVQIKSSSAADEPDAKYF
jgi:hypothetical protein